MTQPWTGRTIRPGEAGYDEARRVFNGLVDRHPERILRPRDTDEVAAAVETTVNEGRALSVYGGGHGVTGSAVVDGGVCIDLRDLDSVEVWPEERLLKVGGGACWGQVDAATQAHGLAVTGGRVSTTGVGGLALGSGSGWLERRCGLTCDNLVEARVVLADGRRVTASRQQNPDLFWGLRGGGGNFGIVTEFIFRLHEIGPTVLGGMLLYPGSQASDVITTWRELVDGAPEELGSAVALITAPPAEFVPEPARGRPAVGVVVCWTGEIDRGRRVLAPLWALGPAADLVQPMPYVAVQRLLDEGNPAGLHNYWSAEFLTELPDRAVETLVANAQAAPSPFTQVILMHGGGAVARVAEEATAFGQRQAPYNLHCLGMWPPGQDEDQDQDQDQANIAHIRATAAAMKRWTAGNAYLNFIGDEGLDRVEAAFGPRKFERLRAIKEVWDPHNVFRHNQNIPPLRQPGEIPEAPVPQP